MPPILYWLAELVVIIIIRDAINPQNTAANTNPSQISILATVLTTLN